MTMKTEQIIYVKCWSKEELKEIRKEVYVSISRVVDGLIDKPEINYFYNLFDMITPIMKTPVLGTFSFMIVFDNAGTEAKEFAAEAIKTIKCFKSAEYKVLYA